MKVSSSELSSGDTAVSLQMKVSCALAVFLALLLLGYCIWISDRAFEITDESYYLLLAMHPEAVSAYNSAQHWITSVLWRMSGSLSAFRLVGLGVLLLSAAVLSIGALCLVSRRSRAFSIGNLFKYALISSAWIAALTYGATINFSPCYNLLATAGGYAALGFAFYAVSQTSGCWVRLLSYLLCGTALAVCFISKASAGFATSGLVLLFISTCDAGRGRFLGVLSVVGGLLVTFVAIMLANTTPNAFAEAVQLGMFMFRQVQTEEVIDRLWRYGVDMCEGIYSATQVFFAPIILWALFAKYKRPLLALSALCLTFLLLVLKGYLLGGVGQYGKIVSTALLLISFAVIVVYPFRSFDSCHRLGLIALFILPYSVALGSGNSIYTQVIVSLAPWGILISILVIFGAENDEARLYLLAVWLVFLFALVVQTVSSGFRKPYNLNLPISKQSYDTTVEAIGRVKVDLETKRFIASLNDAAERCRIKPGRPFLGLYNNPGVALVIGAIPVITPWLNNVEQADTVLGLVDSKTIDEAVIGLHVNEMGGHAPLPKKISGFPVGYTYCGSAVYPWQNRIFQIWILGDRPV